MSNNRILVMDDNEDIRHILKKMLNRINYEVENTGEGNEAIALFKNGVNANNPFHAVITDLKVANGMGGEETIKNCWK